MQFTFIRIVVGDQLKEVPVFDGERGRVPHVWIGRLCLTYRNGKENPPVKLTVRREDKKFMFVLFFLISPDIDQVIGLKNIPDCREIIREVNDFCL